MRILGGGCWVVHVVVGAEVGSRHRIGFLVPKDSGRSCLGWGTGQGLPCCD